MCTRKDGTCVLLLSSVTASDLFFYHPLQQQVSGLWGILYFKEIQGAKNIAKWFASAGVTICGIILLSYEHHKK